MTPHWEILIERVGDDGATIAFSRKMVSDAELQLWKDRKLALGEVTGRMVDEIEQVIEQHAADPT